MIARNAREASRELAGLPSNIKNEVLAGMSAALCESQDNILAANRKDVKKAKTGGLSPALIDRLTLNEKRIEGMAESLREIAQLADPVGEVSRAWRIPNGLWIHKVRVPIGVIAIIYESRPNVTSD